MSLQRPPRPALRPFVALLWAKPATRASGLGREWALPTGAMHLAIRLQDVPLRIYSSATDLHGERVGACVLAGVRLQAFCKETAAVASVGAMLKPGAAQLLMGAPAAAFTGAHTRLEDVWGAGMVDALRERLAATESLERRLALFEDLLLATLPTVRGIDPLIAHSLARLDTDTSVGTLVAETGISHRHLVRRFTMAVGVTPRDFRRLQRFRRSLEWLHATDAPRLADAAAALGYADQAHMTREMREFAGLTPARYLHQRGESAHHVPIAR